MLLVRCRAGYLHNRRHVDIRHYFSHREYKAIIRSRNVAKYASRIKALPWSSPRALWYFLLYLDQISSISKAFIIQGRLAFQIIKIIYCYNIKYCSLCYYLSSCWSLPTWWKFPIRYLSNLSQEYRVLLQPAKWKWLNSIVIWPITIVLTTNLTGYRFSAMCQQTSIQVIPSICAHSFIVILIRSHTECAKIIKQFHTRVFTHFI